MLGDSLSPKLHNLLTTSFFCIVNLIVSDTWCIAQFLSFDFINFRRLMRLKQRLPIILLIHCPPPPVFNSLIFFNFGYHNLIKTNIYICQQANIQHTMKKQYQDKGRQPPVIHKFNLHRSVLDPINLPECWMPRVEY